eukprot:CAMPEP_0117605022 /NCGR_PEP_ID=MMETSP0784-20121206/78983_1 /TAXON_ID=39447 /ORGANISM="" /LENGTH=147 /DNA_ID=CAMNT_0005408061 /DNA_START=395 /DNA_END=838 /DNA_ORIENTATION=-
MELDVDDLELAPNGEWHRESRRLQVVGKKAKAAGVIHFEYRVVRDEPISLPAILVAMVRPITACISDTHVLCRVQADATLWWPHQNQRKPLSHCRLDAVAWSETMAFCHALFREQLAFGCLYPLHARLLVRFLRATRYTLRGGPYAA